jgi:glycosyltransferase involved in cell wall biosynthesis
MPRVLIVCSHYPPHFAGGAEIVAHRQAKCLQRLGWDVKVFAGRLDAPRASGSELALEREEFDGLEVFRTSGTPTDTGANFFSRGHATLFERVARDFAPDVVHCHNLVGLGVNLIGASKRTGARTIVTLHDYWGFCFKGVLLRNDLSLCDDHDACHVCLPALATEDGVLPIRLRRDYVMSELQKADAHIAPSRGLADSYARAGLDPAKISVFSAGINLEQFPPRLRAPSTPTRFLCCAHLGEHKGILVLLDALRRLWDDTRLRGRWTLTIAGTGHLEASLRAELASAGLDAAVTMAGHLPRDALSAEVGRADVVMLPSIWPENEPVSLLEGLASGAALLASAIGGNLDIVEDGANGLTYPNRDPLALAAAMRKLIDDPELVPRFSAENLRRRPAHDEAGATSQIATLYAASNVSRPSRDVIVECDYSLLGRIAMRGALRTPPTLAGRRVRFLWRRWRDADATPIATDRNRASMDHRATSSRVHKPSVLVDLRAAFDGRYGIPQESRLTFALLRNLQGIDTTGLIHHPALPLAPLPRASNRLFVSPAEHLKIMSRLATSLSPRSGRFSASRNALSVVTNFLQLQARLMLGISIPLGQFDGTEFGDFLWQNLFSMTLQPDDFEACRTARYATLSPPWRSMHATSFMPWPRRYAKVNTSGYDAFIAQTPWPGTVHPRTQLIVRYHDSVPIFLPHTLKQPRLMRSFYLSALISNAKSAIFACTSASTKTMLLRIHPELERRSFVVHNCIAPDYFPAPTTREAIADIVASRAAASKRSSGIFDRQNSASELRVKPEDFRFILMVGTLEPRKNHLGMLNAWQALRLRLPSAPALVFVGSPGWKDQHLLRAMRSWQERGELFHLSDAPASEMRMLYSSAQAVVCPSVDEGFDFPAAEAICCGGVVAASDIAVHREMLGEAAAYFNPYSTGSICDTLLQVLTEDKQKDLRQKSLQRRELFGASHTRDQWQEIFEYCRAQRSN